VRARERATRAGARASERLTKDTTAIEALRRLSMGSEREGDELIKVRKREARESRARTEGKGEVWRTTGGDARATADDAASGRERAQEYLRHSPDFADVLGIWDSYHANHAQKVCAPLLALCGTMMTRARETAATRGSGAGGDAWTERERLALDALARAIMSRRMRQVYSHLASGVRVRVCAGLMVLAGIAGRGKRCAAELFRTFDFTLAVLPKLAMPPRDSATKDSAKGQHKRKDGKDVLAGSTRRAFCEFVLAFFAVKDASLLRPVLAQRVLFGNVARFAAGDDPAMQMRVMQVIREDIMDVGSGVPARLRAALFGDVTLEQLATMAGQADADEVSTSGRVAKDAREVLSELFTNSAHGLCPEKSGVASKKSVSIVRLLQKLRPIDCEAHLKILLDACETHPVLASMYLPNAKYSLEPRLSAHWLASAGLLGRVSVAAGADVAASAAASRFDANVTVGESEGLAYIRAVIPPGLTKQTLSKGIAHTSPMIRHATLCLLLSVTQAIRTRMEYLNSAIHEGKLKGSDRVWQIESLVAYAKLGASSVLPEVQSIMAAYTSSKGGKEKDATAALIMRCHALNAVALQVSIIPDTLVDAKTDLHKLLPTNDPTSLPQGELAAVINLLCAAKGLNAAQTDIVNPVASGQEAGVNQGHLLSVFRVVMFASSASARESARRLAKHYLITSGALEGRAMEADVWIDRLTSFKAKGFEQSKDVLMACTEFLAEATTAAARRRFKHDDSIQNELKKHAAERPSHYAVSDELEDEYMNSATLSISALTMTSVENMVKVLNSEKRSKEFKLAVSTYVSSVLMSLVPTSYDPWALALCAYQSISSNISANDDEIYPAVQSIRSFLRQCLTKPDSKGSRRGEKIREAIVAGSTPMEWSPRQLTVALNDLKSISPEFRGQLQFALNAHGPMVDIIKPGVAANVLFGVSRDGDEETELTSALINSFDAAAIVAACASGDCPAIGAEMEQSGPARDLCTRAIASCPALDFVRTVRALVFWCKWNHAKGYSRATARLLEICAAALNRARVDDTVSLAEIRSALFAKTSLYTILDSSTSGSVASLITLNAELSEVPCDLHVPYVDRVVREIREFVTGVTSTSGFIDGSVSLVALATDAEKTSILAACREASALSAAVKVAAAVLLARECGSAVRLSALRLAVCAALDPNASVLVVNQACRVASDSLNALFSRDLIKTRSGLTPDLAAAPESVELLNYAVKNSHSTSLVHLAAAFVAQSDALASCFLANKEMRNKSPIAMFQLLPVVKHVFKWQWAFELSHFGVDLAITYRDAILKYYVAFMDADGGINPIAADFGEDAAETFVMCMKIAPMRTDDAVGFIRRALPSEGWTKRGSLVLAAMATELYAESESVEEQLMFMTSILSSLAVLTRPGKVKETSENAGLEKYLAESLARVLHALMGKNTANQVSGDVLSHLVKATKAFIKQSSTHRFRAHRRWTIIYKISFVLSQVQSQNFEMQALAEFATACIVSHPQFAQALTDGSCDVESQIPSNIIDTVTTVKSILEVTNDASILTAPTEPSNASALKIELLRVLRILWRMQNAGGANGSKLCKQWRADQASTIIKIASGYGATLSEIDRAALDLMLEMDASTGGGALRSLGYLWGDSVNHFVKASIAMRQNTELIFHADDLMYSEPSAALISASIREGTPPDARRAAATVARFPVSRSIPPAEHSATSPTTCDEIVPFGYDPVWMLPFTLHALKAGAMDIRESIAWGLAPLACAALSSVDENTRRIAYAILNTLDEQLKDPLMSFRERTQVLSCLSSLRNATATPMIRWPSPSAILAAECLISCLYPENDTFLPLHRQLNKRAALDLDGVPMFLPMLNSGDVEARQYRVWILRLLRASLKDEIDTTMFRKTFALEVIMSHYSSTLAEPFVRFMMLDVVSRACAVVHSARLLVEGGGLIAWLASVAKSACLNDKYDIRAGETTSMRVATAHMATSALVTLIRQKGSIYLGPTGTAADYLSALHAIRAVILRRDVGSSNAEVAARRAALGPYLKLHVEIAARLRRRIAEVGDPVEIAELCRTVAAAPDAASLGDDMFTIIVTSEGGGQYAKRCTHETSRALADAVVFCASWAAVHARDVAKRPYKSQDSEEAFQKLAYWCASALASGGATFANALVRTPECGGAARFAAIMSSCARAAGSRALKSLDLPLIAAHLCLLRTIELVDDSSAELSLADRAIHRNLRSVAYAESVAAGGALDAVVGGAAAGDPSAALLARTFLRGLFAGVEPRAFEEINSHAPEKAEDREGAKRPRKSPATEAKSTKKKAKRER